MKIIVGLGNPGEKYQKTRHNMGFLFLDFLASEYHFPDFSIDSKFKSLISQKNINGEKIILLKPLTFMNLSGEALSLIMHYYKAENSDFIVIYDDVSLEFGKIRYRKKGSAGGQNGIKNIIKHRGEIFERIKIGIGQNPKYELSNWVLSTFTQEELIELDREIFPKALEEITNFLNT